MNTQYATTKAANEPNTGARRGRISAVFGFVTATIIPFAAMPAGAEVLQCTTFVKDELTKSQPKTDFSGLKGNAGQWAKATKSAVGSNAVSSKPSKGSIMVFAGNGDKASYPKYAIYAAETYGHVALVKKVEDSSTIKVDHANWSAKGKIDRNVKVVTTDKWVTASVYNVNTGAMGGGKYAVAGFIDPSKFPTKKK